MTTPAEPTTPGAPPTEQPATPPAPPAPAPTPAPPAEPTTPGAPAEPADVSQLPAWAQKLLTDTRKEAGDHRLKLRDAEAAAQAAQKAADDAATKQTAMLDTIAKGLGLKPDDTPPDPAKLAEQLSAAKSETEKRASEKREADVMLAVYRAAGKHEADADALLDSRSFQRAVKDLDPSSADFADRIGEAITKAVESNPRYKVTAPVAPPKAPVKAKSGGEFSGSPGGNRQWTDADVDSATPTQLNEAIASGLLVDLGINPPRAKR